MIHVFDFLKDTLHHEFDIFNPSYQERGENAVRDMEVSVQDGETFGVEAFLDELPDTPPTGQNIDEYITAFESTAIPEIKTVFYKQGVVGDNADFQQAKAFIEPFLEQFKGKTTTLLHQLDRALVTDDLTVHQRKTLFYITEALTKVQTTFGDFSASIRDAESPADVEADKTSMIYAMILLARVVQATQSEDIDHLKRDLAYAPV
jgi:hypothetical protein